MHNSRVNDDQADKRVDETPQRENDPPHFHDSAVLHSNERGDRLHLEALLPFLEERIDFRMPSELRHLDVVLDYLNERMVRLGIVNPEDSEVLIALDEAIVNAIKHGNKCDPRKAVHISAEFNAEGVRFVISDEGPGFARENVPDPTQPCRLLEPSGRGLLLINHIMDEVQFNQCGNRLEMFKRPVNRAQSHNGSCNGNNGSE